ncbi:facilitated trehalose transporter Tret1-like [Contarinia nasturtii]|uniref:facilitated trehalose transporter Tret1-like n=1 Tax=Contarinia nasturtii TaxID=265458 RepID=UPI0012D3C82A|nr:facilitated trehalose transporter Tret1-like [Contarinia nasturtii]XP_031624258.1 facilitated trehalose transporter Tret1-like [Contarinia nasturtii]
MADNHKNTEDDEKTTDATYSGLLEKCDNTVEQTNQKSTKTGLYRQILLTTIVTPVMISLAHSLAFPALIIPELRKENGTISMTEDEEPWFTSTFSVASPIGSLISGFMMDRYGRKITLATPLIPLILSWIVLASAQTKFVLFLSRIVLGVCGGFGPPICQIYLAETADAEFRGVTINLGYVTLSTGFLLTFALGAAMSWRHLAWCGIIFPIITLAGIALIPESPIFLIRSGNIERAYKSFLWLRGDKNIARNELNKHLSQINQENEANQAAQNNNSWRDFFQPSVLKPIVIIFAFILFFNLSGTYLLIYYAIDILDQVHLKISSHNASVIISLVRLIVTIVFCWLFTKIKRRPIYLIAGIGSTCSTLILAAYLHFEGQFASETLKLLVAGSLLLLYVSTNTAFMITPGFLTGELLPAKIRGRLAGYIYTYFSVVTFILNKFFPNLNSLLGLTGVIFVFGLASLATTCLVYFMVPETKGKTLLEIERYFQEHGWIYKSSQSPSGSIQMNQ